MTPSAFGAAPRIDEGAAVWARVVGWIGGWRGYALGLALVGALSVLAVFGEDVERRISGAPSAPVEALVIAILLGILVRNTIGLPGAAVRGVSFAAKPLLEFAVFILG